MRIGTLRSRRWLLLVAGTVGPCSPARGCLESSVTLSQELRLPKGFASVGIARVNSEVTMDDDIGPAGRTATFTLRDANGRHIASVVGQQQRNEPKTLEPHGPTGPLSYPSDGSSPRTGLPKSSSIAGWSRRSISPPIRRSDESSASLRRRS